MGKRIMLALLFLFMAVSDAPAYANELPEFGKTNTGFSGLKAGLDGQIINDIVISEPVEGAIMEGEIYVRLPRGISWDGVPSVGVSEGDLEIGPAGVDIQEGNLLIIPVEDESSVTSVITISNIKVTVSRDFPAGRVDVKIGGTALNETYFNKEFMAWSVARTIDGECITPAAGEIQTEATLVSNSDENIYVVGGRAFAPVRYVADVLDINQNNVIYDRESGMVSLLKGNKVVQVTVGSDQLSINGVPVTMDTNPFLNGNDVMVPLRWVANAFGATVTFDAKTGKIVISLESSQRN